MVTGQATQTFTTDLADRVTQIGPNVATYRYDGHGRRTTVTKGGTTAVQVYSQAGQLLYQCAPAIDGIFKNGFQPGDQNYAQNGGNKRYVYLGRHLIAEDGTAGRTYIHTDGLGSPVRTTNTSGEATARKGCQPYGWGPQAQSTPGFTGHVADAETGLSYMQARYYDPYAGRFLAVDPVAAEAGSFNRYWYANNNPYKKIDPDGRNAVDRFGDAFAKDPQAFEAFRPVAEAVVPGMGVAQCLGAGCDALGWAAAAADGVPGGGKLLGLLGKAISKVSSLFYKSPKLGDLTNAEIRAFQQGVE